ncbi:MAG: hypothetical protein J6O18_05655 [Bacilli bacterium]|nr:hypothetical protein [Bacilli bacterium]
MISQILFILFFITLAVGAVLAIYFGARAYGSGKKAREPAARKPFRVGLIVAGVAILGLAFIPGSFHQVETGTVAVVRQLGKIEGVRNPGTYFDFYLTRSYEIYDTKVQQDRIVTSAYSKDGQTMELEVFLQYQVQTENIMKIATEYGNLNALQARIETVTVEKTKAVMSSAEAMTIVQNRSVFSNDVSESVREGISADYYVNVRDVVLTNIDFTNEFEKAVEDKAIAEQEKQASITRAEAELEVAKLEAQRKIAEAEGNAEAQKIIAQAAAEAASSKLIELSRSIGYDVTTEYIYKSTVDKVYGSGKEEVTKSEQVSPAKLAETTTVVISEEDGDTVTTTTTLALEATKHTIDVTSGPGVEKFKTLVEDYMKYIAYLETWNGELPDVVAGDNAVSIIIPSEPNP